MVSCHCGLFPRRPSRISSISSPHLLCCLSASQAWPSACSSRFYHATAELNLLSCLTFSIPGDAFPSSRVGTQRRAGILQANGGKPGRAAPASLRGTSSAMQMHPPVKEEAEIYAPMQKHMLLIRGWHSHTRFQLFQDAVLALHSCFSISDL